MRFVDIAKIKISSGSGGRGKISFRRESCVPKGGPDGGDGGKGGSVIFKTNSQMHSLLDFHYNSKYKAEDGKSGGQKLCSGAKGKDLIIEVPLGTLIKDLKGRVLFDLDDEKKECLFLKGGRGGKGNAFFKSSVNQSPKKRQEGEKGTSRTIYLELKLLADVGLIGLPNAGKSTLISRISDARSKIADYPFTTLIPQLGVVQYQKSQSIVVADLPGLIKGAHLGKGLGVQFLRHIERTRFLVHVLDVMGGSVKVVNLKEKNEKSQEAKNKEAESKKMNQKPLKEKESFEKSIWENYKIIQKELESYDQLFSHSFEKKSLREKKQIVVFNKSDLVSDDKIRVLIAYFRTKGVKAFSISAVTGKNIKDLIYTLGKLIFNSPV